VLNHASSTYHWYLPPPKKKRRRKKKKNHLVPLSKGKQVGSQRAKYSSSFSM
jgi:hypothetical protein